MVYEDCVGVRNAKKYEWVEERTAKNTEDRREPQISESAARRADNSNLGVDSEGGYAISMLLYNRGGRIYAFVILSTHDRLVLHGELFSRVGDIKNRASPEVSSIFQKNSRVQYHIDKPYPTFDYTVCTRQ